MRVASANKTAEKYSSLGKNLSQMCGKSGNNNDE